MNINVLCLFNLVSNSGYRDANLPEYSKEDYDNNTNFDLWLPLQSRNGEYCFSTK